MSTLRLLLSLALLVICAMCEASTGKFSTCCTRVSAGKPSPDTIIENFIIQPKDLPCVHAVMFITNKGKIICSTPSARWVKLKIQELEKKNEKENINLNNQED